MNYKELAEDALAVALNATQAGVAADHMARANVYATLHLAEQQRIGNVLRFATDFTEDAEYKSVGVQAREWLGLK